MEQVLNPTEAASILRCRASSVLVLIDSGKLPAIKQGPQWEIRLADVLGFIDEETERQSRERRRRHPHFK